jgi:hypothetical protein
MTPTAQQQPPGRAGVQHLLALGSFRNWLRLARRNGVDRAFRRRALFITAASALTAPLRMYERARYNRAVARTRIAQPPIFILGHWRSGTTNLHYLMSQDPQLGYITMFQMIAPDMLFVGERAIKPAFAKVTPTRRPIDNLPLSIDGAQEEEFGLATMSPHSFYHGWFFPRQLEHYLQMYALFNTAPPHVVAEWKELYLHMLRKATLNMGGKRLLIKNPTNTGRVRQLLELFPDARFVNIVRDPYRVFLSMRYMVTVNYNAMQLQTVTPAEIEEHVLHIYEAVMQQYLRDRALIPPENLVEVRFEDLEQAPLAVVERVYAQLGLPGFAEALPRFRAYVDSLRGYQKNPLTLSDEDIAKVNQRWSFAFDAWNYPRLSPGAGRGSSAQEDGLLAKAVGQ